MYKSPISMNYIQYFDSPLGKIILQSNGIKLTGLYFENQKNIITSPGIKYHKNSIPIFIQTKKWLTIYFEGKIPDFTPELSLNCSAFRKEVLNLLLKIPYGKTVSYGEISQKIAEHHGIPRMSSQAIGGAVSHNPIAIIIPCHRVIGKQGNLTGYSGGLERKKKLLELENPDITKILKN